MEEEKTTQQETPVKKEDIDKVVEELQKLNASRIVKASESLTKLLAFQFMKGVFMGLGSIIGVAVVLSALSYLLAQVEFIPIVGDFVHEIVSYVYPDYTGGEFPPDNNQD